MKVIAILLATLSVASAFAPQSSSRANTALNEKLFDSIFGMDLFAPNPDVNKYGARGKKNLKQGSIGSNSYVPSGLTASQYSAVRAKDAAKTDSNYKKNVAKAGKFQDFTQFYLKRGTSEGGNWLSSAGRGHTFAKLKYEDQEDQKVYDGSGSIFGFGKKK